MPEPTEFRILIDQISEVRADVREDLVQMERRLTERLDAIRPKCQSHESRIIALETKVTSMDTQRRTILGMVAIVGGFVSSVVTYIITAFIRGRL